MSKNNSSLHSIYEAIVQGFVANGELSPEKLAEKGGDIRVRTLCVHAVNLAKRFHSEFEKVNAKDAA